MRKIIASVMVSVDGLFEGPGNDISWHVWDEDMSNYMVSFFNTVDTIILGRKAYELMADYWPSAESEHPVITHCMNHLPKLVFSRTLRRAAWNNTTLMREVDRQQVAALKEQRGKNMVIFGGAGIIRAFMQHRLIDEYRLIMNPVILGAGKNLFHSVKGQMSLLQSRHFENGNVLMHYKEKEND